MDSSLAGPRTAGSPGPFLQPVDWLQLDGSGLHARYYTECRGGDFFDGLSLGHRVLFLLTDIAGPRTENHGVACEVQKAFRQGAQELFAGADLNESDAIAALAHAVNLSLIEAAHGVRFAPTFLGCFNRTLGILTYCNAGNLPAFFRDASNVRLLESGGMPLGLFSHTTFEAVFLAFQKGDILLLVTKGVIESRRAATGFGAQRVERLLRNTTAKSAAQICEAVLRAAHDFAKQPWLRLPGLRRAGRQPRYDDLTALALVRE